MGTENALFQKLGRRVPAGTILFKEGETGNQMFVIQSGKVKISKRAGESEKTLAILTAGEFFGEMAILNSEPRAATAEVIEESKLLLIDPKTFEAMIRGNTEIAFRMIKKLSERLKQANDQIGNLLIKDNNTVVINTIARTVENEGMQTEGGVKIKLTVKDISVKTGIEYEKVHDVVNKLIKVRLISVQSYGLLVSDLSKLRKFLDFLTLKEQFGDA